MRRLSVRLVKNLFDKWGALWTERAVRLTGVGFLSVMIMSGEALIF